ncbi:hypothetical protein BV22DRAFT_348575 [Leucogyrophana mollusca]|uniref:Uncharacterized protein n=1 Tax=Leucogyrophana mollusca TaxID=85980 RepID=A0ACB8BNT7_9AGAM|nr:hypothetical protein BV22DRAFT_348575 [Leucogyrophana mollusca]
MRNRPAWKVWETYSEISHGLCSPPTQVDYPNKTDGIALKCSKKQEAVRIKLSFIFFYSFGVRLVTLAIGRMYVRIRRLESSRITSFDIWLGEFPPTMHTAPSIITCFQDNVLTNVSNGIKNLANVGPYAFPPCSRRTQALLLNVHLRLRACTALNCSGPSVTQVKA